MDARTGAAGVRLFAEEDRAELREVFRRAGEGESVAPFEGYEESVWLDPYMDAQPDSLFVAVRDGALVGYLTGCPDPSGVPTEKEHLARLIREERLLLKPAALRMMLRSAVDVLRAGRKGAPADFSDPRWPAHLHIRLVPEGRGVGLGRALMLHWQDRLRELGSPGCHLQVLHENTTAVAFFERMGFTRRGAPLPIPGYRDERGGRLHRQIMVWSP
ncbi:GNAT family N-acetyltransferase [Nocardiopsis composta]|uniref:Ribosomal protein S18 acetylase RimI-like enzyme n=1 Tax=Nocardiopsis composta TaxID=157465 RepID=A0A7W8VD05_9ACTN|nr:GNAT family N-acetyltransferase [Nocardiopsis composta]MBB5431498.1 ribosomal protein S18 acetylase RimI-like enzyme [Nocardiopsis composta]